MALKVLQSAEDRSVNFVEDRLAGFLEARFVRRSDEYFVCYLSSHTGCNRGCTFCHLTATGQTSFAPTSLNEYVEQALRVMAHYRRTVAEGARPVRYVHFSFMARGEPLANPLLLDRAPELLTRLGQIAADEGLPAKFAVSTIMPQTLRRPLFEVFKHCLPTVYYSMYSVREEFRKRWMPGAMHPDAALAMLADWQRFSKKIVKVHHALIAGQNDSVTDAEEVCEALDRHGILAEFNLVRYNPASPEQGEESDEFTRARYMEVMASRLPGRIKAIDRVGYDVNASCGMFAR